MDAKQATDHGNAGVLEPKRTEEIIRLVRPGDARAIEAGLPPLLAEIRMSGGSVGTELVSAGFAPAPALPERYGYDRNNDSSVLVTVRGDEVEVRVQENK